MASTFSYKVKITADVDQASADIKKVLAMGEQLENNVYKFTVQSNTNLLSANNQKMVSALATLSNQSSVSINNDLLKRQLKSWTPYYKKSSDRMLNSKTQASMMAEGLKTLDRVYSEEVKSGTGSFAESRKLVNSLFGTKSSRYKNLVGSFIKNGTETSGSIDSSVNKALNSALGVNDWQNYLSSIFTGEGRPTVAGQKLLEEITNPINDDSYYKNIDSYIKQRKNDKAVIKGYNQIQARSKEYQEYAKWATSEMVDYKNLPTVNGKKISLEEARTERNRQVEIGALSGISEAEEQAYQKALKERQKTTGKTAEKEQKKIDNATKKRDKEKTESSKEKTETSDETIKLDLSELQGSISEIKGAIENLIQALKSNEGAVEKNTEARTTSTETTEESTDTSTTTAEEEKLKSSLSELASTLDSAEIKQSLEQLSSILDGSELKSSLNELSEALDGGSIRETINSLESTLKTSLNSLSESLNGEGLKSSIESFEAKVSELSTALGSLETIVKAKGGKREKASTVLKNALTSGFTDLLSKNQSGLNARYTSEAASKLKSTYLQNDISLTDKNNIVSKTLGKGVSQSISELEKVASGTSKYTESTRQQASNLLTMAKSLQQTLGSSNGTGTWYDSAMSELRNFYKQYNSFSSQLGGQTNLKASATEIKSLTSALSQLISSSSNASSETINAMTSLKTKISSASEISQASLEELRGEFSQLSSKAKSEASIVTGAMQEMQAAITSVGNVKFTNLNALLTSSSYSLSEKQGYLSSFAKQITGSTTDELSSLLKNKNLTSAYKNTISSYLNGDWADITKGSGASVSAYKKWVAKYQNAQSTAQNLLSGATDDNNILASSSGIKSLLKQVNSFSKDVNQNLISNQSASQLQNLSSTLTGTAEISVGQLDRMENEFTQLSSTIKSETAKSESAISQFRTALSSLSSGGTFDASSLKSQLMSITNSLRMDSASTNKVTAQLISSSIPQLTQNLSNIYGIGYTESLQKKASQVSSILTPFSSLELKDSANLEKVINTLVSRMAEYNTVMNQAATETSTVNSAMGVLKSSMNAVYSGGGWNTDAIQSYYTGTTEEMRTVLDNMANATTVDDFSSMYNSMSKAYQNKAKYTAKYQELLTSGMSDIENSAFVNGTYTNLSTGEPVDVAKLAKVASSTSSAMTKVAKSSNVEKLNVQIERFLSDNTKLNDSTINSAKTIKQAIADIGVNNLSQAGLDSYTAQFNKLKQEAIAAGEAGKNFASVFKNQIRSGLAQSLYQYFSLYDIIYYLRQALSIVTEIDTEIANLRKVSDASESQLESAYDSAVEISQELGTNVSDTLSSTTDWARLGYDLDEATELARVTALYVNVSEDMEVEDATEYLISTLEGFELEADEAESVIDKINEVANNFPIDSEGIGEALQRSSASFNAANTDLSQSIALITATNSVVQDPDSVGTMWKTVSARIRGAESELEDLDEESDEYVESTSKLQNLVKSITGVDIMLDEDTYKDIYTIMVEIGEVWDDLTDINQASLLEALAGKRQANSLAATLSNVDMLKEAYETAENSEGSAETEEANWEKSIEYSIDRVKATAQDAIANILDADMVKGIVDGFNQVLGVVGSVVDQVGVLGVALTTVGAIFTQKTGMGLLTYNKGTNKWGGLLGNLAQPSSTITKAEQQMINGYYNDIMLAWNKNPLATFYDKEIQAVTNRYGFTPTSTPYKVAEEAMAKEDLAVGTNELMAAQKSVQTFGQKATGMLKNIAGQGLQMAAIMAGVAVFQAIVDKVQELTITIDEASEAAENFSGSFSDTQSTIQTNTSDLESLAEEYAALDEGVSHLSSTSVENSSLSTDDYDRYLEVCNEIAELAPEMVTGYDEQGNAILNCADNLDELYEAYEKVAQAEYDALNESENASAVWQNYLNNTNQVQGDNTEAGFWSKLAGSFGAVKNALTQNVVAGSNFTTEEATNLANEMLNALTNESLEITDIPENLLYYSIDGVSYRDILEAVQSGNAEDIASLSKTLQNYITELAEDTASALSSAQDLMSSYLLGSYSGYYDLDDDAREFAESLITGMSSDDITSLFGDTDDYESASEAQVRTWVELLENNESLVEEYEKMQELVANKRTSKNLSKMVPILEDLSAETGLSVESFEEMFDVADDFANEDAFDNFLDGLDTSEGSLKKLKSATKNYSSAQKANFLEVVSELKNTEDEVNTVADALQALKNVEIKVLIDAESEADQGIENLLSEDGSFEAAEEAVDNEDEDFGSTYASMKEMLDTAKTLYNQGHTGTTEFKEIASMFQTYGLDDADLFADSLDTYKKYFKGDSKAYSALTSFLEDLEDLGYAEDLGGGDYSVSIADYEQAAQELGISYTALIALMDELQAQGMTTLHFESSDDAYAYYGDAQEDLIDLQNEINELEAEGADSDTIQAKKDEYEELKETIQSVVDLIPELKEAEAESNKQDKSTLRSTFASIDEMATEAYEGTGDYSSSTKEERQLALGSIANSMQDYVNEWESEFGELDPEKNSKIVSYIDSINEALEEWGLSDYSVTYGETSDEEEEEENDLDNISISADKAIINADSVEGESEESESSSETKEINETESQSTTGLEDPSETLESLAQSGEKVEQESSGVFETLAEKISGLLGQDSEEGKTESSSSQTSISADGSQATEEANEVSDSISEIPDDKDTEMKVTGIDTAITKLNNLYKIINKLSSITLTVKATTTSSDSGTTSGTTSSSSKSIKSKAYGTLRAYDNGTISSDQTAVVNELGEEGLIRNGTLSVIKGGMQTMSLKKGDIIINHKQMEQLGKGQKVTANGGRGKLIGTFAGGTLSGMSAYSNIGGVSSGRGPKGKSSSSSSSDSGSSSSSSSSDDATTAAEKLSKKFDNLVDWIEVWIDRTNTYLDRYETISDNLTNSLSYRNKNLQSGINLAQKSQNKASTSASRYLKQANSVGLSKKYQKLVQQGKYNKIESIDSDSKRKVKIDEYTKWYEKYQDALDQQLEWQQKIVDLESEKLDNIVQYYETLQDTYSTHQDIYSAKNELRVAQGQSQALGTATWSNYNTQVKDQKNQTKTLKKEQKKYSKELKTAKKTYAKANTNVQTKKANLQEAKANTKAAKKKYGTDSDEYKKALKKQKKAEKQYNKAKKNSSNKNEEYLSAKSQLNEIKTQIVESKTTTQELLNEMNDLKVELLDWEVQKWTRLLEKIAAASEYYQSKNTSNEQKKADTISSSQSSVTAYSNQILAAQEELEEVMGQLADVSADSEEGQDLLDQATSLKTEILEAATSVYEALDEILDAYISSFNDLADEYLKLSSDAQDLVDLLGTESFVDDAGNLTDNGLAGLALYAADMANNAALITAYTDELAQFEADWEAGLYDDLISEEEYAEIVDEWTSSINELVAANDDLKDSIIDVYEAQITAENELLQDNISLRQEALQKKKDYYDYDKTLKQQNKDMQSLRAQIAALEGTSSAAGQAKLAALKEQLSEAEDEQEDTILEHKYSLLSDAYSDLADNAQDALDETLEALETNADLQQSIVESMLDTIVGDYTTAYDTIQDLIEDTGYQTSDSFETLVEELTSASDATSLIESAITATGTGVGAAADGAQLLNNALNEINTSLLEQLEGMLEDLNTAYTTYTSSGASDVAEDTAENATVDDTAFASATQGNGKVNVGDMVTFESGYAYQGKNSTKKVENSNKKHENSYYVTKKESGAEHPIRLSTKKKKGKVFGWVKKKQISGYKQGGLADYTGLAQLDGTPSKPEMVLNAADTENFIELKDAMQKLASAEGSVSSLFNNPLESIPDFADGVNIESDAINSTVSPEVNITSQYDSLLTVNGNVDQEFLPTLKNLLEESYKYTSEKMYKDIRKTGLWK